MRDERIEELAKQVKAGSMGKGLNLKRNLGDDFEAVIKACQDVPSLDKKSKKQKVADVSIEVEQSSTEVKAEQ